MIRLTIILVTMLLSVAANAQSVRLKNYLHPENDRLRFLNETYLAGAVDGLTAYNMAASTKLFCKDDAVVSHEEAARLVSEWAAKQTKMPDDTLIVIPLLLLLKKVYPCP